MATRAGFAAGAPLRSHGLGRSGFEQPKPAAVVKDTSASVVSIPLPGTESLTIDVATTLLNRVSADDEISTLSKSARSLAATSPLARLNSRNPGSIHTAASMQSLLFHPKPVIPFPKAIVDDIKATPSTTGAVVAGLLPEINRAYIAVESRLYLWDYTRGGSVYLFHPTQAYAGGAAASAAAADPVLAVALVTPRPGVFIDSIRTCLAVAYKSYVTLLAVHFDSPPTVIPSASGNAATVSVALAAPSTLGELDLIDTGLSVPTGGVRVTSLQGTDCGRVFYGGDDGCLYEFLYDTNTLPTVPGAGAGSSAAAQGVSSVAESLSAFAGAFLCGRQRCRKTNHTKGSGSSAVPAARDTGLLARIPALFSTAATPTSVLAMCYDNSRRTQLLTVLLSNSVLQLWYLTPDGTPKLACELAAKDYFTQVAARLGGISAFSAAASIRNGAATGRGSSSGIEHEYEIVSVAVVPMEANPDVHVAATTSGGHRVFLAFTTVPGTTVFAQEKRALTVIYVRPAAVMPSPALPALENAGADAAVAVAGGLAPRVVYTALTTPGGEAFMAMAGFTFPPVAPASATSDDAVSAFATASAARVVRPPAIDLVRRTPGAAMPATTTLMLLSPDLPTDARGLVTVTAAADPSAAAAAAANGGASSGSAAAAATAVANASASAVELRETAEYVHLGPRVYAIAELPASYYLSSPGRFLFSSTQSIPLAGLHELAVQHAVPPKQFVALTGRGVLFFVKDRPVDVVAAALARAMARSQPAHTHPADAGLHSSTALTIAGAEAAAVAAPSPASPTAIAAALTGLLAQYDGSEVGAMLLTVACQPRRVAVAAGAAAATGLLSGPTLDSAVTSAAADGGVGAINPVADALIRIPASADAAALERTAAIAFINLNTVAVTAGTPNVTRMTPRTMALVRQVRENTFYLTCILIVNVFPLFFSSLNT